MQIRATATYTARSSAGEFIAAHITPGLRDGIEDAGKVVLLEAQAIVPVDTGELRDSGHVEMRDTDASIVADVIFDAPHAAFVEFGTGIRGATSAGAGPYPYNPSWPGMPSQPYLRPALDASKPEMAGVVALRMRY